MTELLFFLYYDYPGQSTVESVHVGVQVKYARKIHVLKDAIGTLNAVLFEK